MPIPDTDLTEEFTTLLGPGDPGYPTKIIMEMEVARRKWQNLILDDHQTVIRYFKKVSECFEWLTEHSVTKIRLCGEEKEWEIEFKTIQKERKNNHG